MFCACIHLQVVLNQPDDALEVVTRASVMKSRLLHTRNRKYTTNQRAPTLEEIKSAQLDVL